MADTKIFGYDIDKNTVAMFNLHSVANDQAFWAIQTTLDQRGYSLGMGN